METITITKRVINGKEVYSKRFDDYEKGLFGKRISKSEYEKSKSQNTAKYTSSNEHLNIVERITYEN